MTNPNHPPTAQWMNQQIGQLMAHQAPDGPRGHITNNAPPGLNKAAHALRDQAIVQAQLQITNNGVKILDDIQTRDKAQYPKARDVRQHQPNTELTTCFDRGQQTALYSHQLRPDGEDFDDTLPQTEEEKRRPVAILVRALLTTSMVAEGSTIPKQFTDGSIDLRFAECRCWEALSYLIVRSKSRVSYSRIYSTDQRAERLQFADRFDSLVQDLLEQKAITRGVLSMPYIVKLVDDPISCLRNTRANKKSNDQKGQDIKKARQERREGKDDQNTSAPPIGEDNEDVDLEADNQPSAKKQRTQPPGNNIPTRGRSSMSRSSSFAASSSMPQPLARTHSWDQEPTHHPHSTLLLLQRMLPSLLI